MPPAFATRTLGAKADGIAPDGTALRLLVALKDGSMAHFELPAGAVSYAVRHRTVEELWYVVAGRGLLWRRLGEAESVETLEPGVAATIPLGAAFQFRADAEGPLAFVAVTMPPWPGMDEAVPADGPWQASIPAGR
jgi:mannose-6-phosphate isomerase-like protein (cupin superfamily)